MALVVDDLVAWLVALFADAGRKKLTTLVLGSDQDRALRQAATVAIQLTATQLTPSGGAQAEQLAIVVSQVFHEPTPEAALAGQATLLEALQAGIAANLAVLDDARLTGTGQSSAEVLGVPGSVLAAALASHLVREIMLRGSGGGPLAPLADQLNHDVTHLQGQRIEGALAQLADQVTALARPSSAAVLPGKPVRLLPRRPPAGHPSQPEIQTSQPHQALPLREHAKLPAHVQTAWPDLVGGIGRPAGLRGMVADTPRLAGRLGTAQCHRRLAAVALVLLA